MLNSIVGAVAATPIEPNTRPVPGLLPSGSEAGKRALETQAVASTATARQNKANSARPNHIDDIPGMQCPYRICAAGLA
ncbi:hypothetical protein HZ992_18385 [Rhizobacter sp. AJA081-3]|uniref:hypothetical protein n=1 Tax=Rhizobacter sp. AJA081-3 TaxID=2753607 RepID=UPI001ADFE2CA|nr:hypothetical protein [Rhizobacter sp. AJA081-3]QTN22112.1 hypothetical protein HZ992_18385 [Rhizobacter sp. AJA081-3]